jgi:hypothetical protein
MSQERNVDDAAAVCAAVLKVQMGFSTSQECGATRAVVTCWVMCHAALLLLVAAGDQPRA